MLTGEYGLATLDRRQVFTADFVYDLPFFTAQKGLVGKTFVDWEVIRMPTSTQDAEYQYTTLVNFDPAGLGILGSSAASPRPNMVCDPNQNAPHTRFQWFNASCFSNVPTGVHLPGNAGRGVAEGTFWF